MKKRILAVLTALALALSVGAVTAEPAAAGAVCDRTHICGRIVVSTASSSVCTVQIADSWSLSKRAPSKAGPYIPLRDKAGYKRDSKAYYKDTDAFYISSNCKGKGVGGTSYSTWASGKWHKINDATSFTIKVTPK